MDKYYNVGLPCANELTANALKTLVEKCVVIFIEQSGVGACEFINVRVDHNDFGRAVEAVKGLQSEYRLGAYSIVTAKHENESRWFFACCLADGLDHYIFIAENDGC